MNKVNLICGIIISFNDGYSLRKSVEAISKQLDWIIIVDNGSDSETQSILDLIEAKELFATIIRLDNNYGIAYALNRGVERALLNAAQWVVTFDQDSIPSDQMIENMLVFANLHNRENLDIAFLTPKISHNQETYLSKLESPKNVVAAAITSGNMVNIEVFKKIGLYDEALFIDSVDFEFCLRARSAGYKIFSVSSATLHHNLGSSKCFNFMGVSFHIYTHSPLRRYYIMRNHLYLQKQYLSKFPLFFMKKTFFLIIMLLQIVLLEEQKYLNIKMVALGIRHYLKGVKGKFIC